MREVIDRLSRPALIAVGVLGLTVSIGILGLAQPGRPGGPGRSFPAPKLKNIKVLKNVPANQMIPVMRNISASLGVRCDFCHVVNPDRTGFEKDTRPEKNVARQMILMVNDLNVHQKILKGKTTCYMCHHGRPTPETKAPAMPMGGGVRPGGMRRGGMRPPARGSR